MLLSVANQVMVLVHLLADLGHCFAFAEMQMSFFIDELTESAQNE